ncbi:hypothetical protein [Spongiivirga citrea]|uniref:DUF2306 domain-containing protein n=1 Tax=Spongiivirga citrea TaxID=1481457 RepID=A0A6M0CHY7_9FLAO|nr:hypothetical protein [Spongiivirga citrea]NER16563.1 hypothetical protein [Spongiivirga citrea]
MERKYKNVGAFMVILLPITFIAFFESYFKYLPSFPDTIATVTHIHTIAGLIWIIMLIAQPWFIKKGMMNNHRIIGRLSYVVFPIFVITAVILISNTLFSEYGRFAIIPVGETLILIICYSLAIFNRKHPQLHMLYMIGTGITLLGPTLARILPYFLSSWTVLQRENLKLLMIQAVIISVLYLDRKMKEIFVFYYIMVAFLTHQIFMNFILS